MHTLPTAYIQLWYVVRQGKVGRTRSRPIERAVILILGTLLYTCTLLPCHDLRMWCIAAQALFDRFENNNNNKGGPQMLG